MPITNDQFKNGLDDTSAKILDFLRKNRNSAYEVGEITTAIGWSATEAFWKNFAGAWVVVNSLGELIKKGLIEKKTIQGKDYYKAK